MAAVFTLTCLSLIHASQERPPRSDAINGWVERLGDPDAACRNHAAAEIEALTLDLIAAIHLLSGASHAADQDALRRRERIQADWLLALGGFVPPERYCTPRAGPSEDPASDTRMIRRRLRTLRVTLDLANAPLTAIVETLRERSGLSIHVADGGLSDDLMISVHARDETPDSLLRRILKPRGMTYTIQDAMVLIIPTGLLRNWFRIELYDVQDLTFEQSGEELIEKIVKEVHPDQWRQADGVSIQFQNGLLIVRNTAPVHDALGKFLRRAWTGRPEATAPPLRNDIVTTVRDLTGSARDRAEARLSGLGRDAAYALGALSRAATSEDLEVRLWASALSRAATRNLGEEPTRRMLLTDELQALVRELRAMWAHDTDFDDYEEEARSILGSRAVWVQVIARATKGDALLTAPVAQALWNGDAVVLVEQGMPLSPTPQEWLEAGGKLLVFTLPQDPEERQGDEGPACVVVKVNR